MKRWLFSVVLALILPVPSGYCGEGLGSFRDPMDGSLDLSEWLLDRKGFLPVPVIITEPAIGYGAGLFALFFRQSMREAAAQSLTSGRTEPPDIFVVGGLATQNGTWLGATGGMVSFDDHRYRWRGGIARLNANLDFFGLGGTLPAAIGYNADGWASIQQGMVRLGQSGSPGAEITSTSATGSMSKAMPREPGRSSTRTAPPGSASRSRSTPGTTSSLRPADGRAAST